MTSYRELYFYLFGVMADAVEDFERGETILRIQRLISALREAEDRTAEVELVPEVVDIRFGDFLDMDYTREKLERYDSVIAEDDNIIK